MCRLCGCVFVNPFTAACGDSFCHRCIAEETVDCPRHRTAAKPLVVNLALCDQVGDLLIRCRYGLRPKLRPSAESPDSGLTSPSSLLGCNSSSNGGCGSGAASYEVDPDGCSAEIRLAARTEHESSCPHSPAACGKRCGKYFKLRDLPEHELNCSGGGGGGGGGGCGSGSSPSSCSPACISTRQRMEKQIRHLQDQMDERSRDLEFLRSMLGTVVDRLDRLDRHIEERFLTLDMVQSEHQDLLVDSQAKHERLQEALALVNEQMACLASLQPGGHAWQTFKCLGTFVGHRGPIWCLLVGGDYLYSASGDKSVKMWQVGSSNELLKTLDGHTGPALSLALSGSVLFSGSQDSTVRVWDVAPTSANFGSCLQVVVGHTESVSTLCVSKFYLFSGSLNVVKVWDLATRECKRTLTGFSRWVRALVVSQQLLYVGSGNAVTLIELTNFSKVRSLCTDEETNNVHCVQLVLPDFIIAGTGSGSLLVWEADEAAASSSVAAAASSGPDSDSESTAGATKSQNSSAKGAENAQKLSDGKANQAQVLNRAKRESTAASEPAHVLKGHSGQVSCLSVMRTSAGLKLLSGSHDMTVAVWSLHNMMRTQTLQRHQGIVTAMAVANGRLFSGSADCSMRVWVP